MRAGRIYDARADKGAVFAPAVKAGAGLSHIVSKDSRVDSFPSLIVYGMAELSADYSSRFTEWRVSPGAGPRAGMKLSPCAAAALIAELSYMRYPGCGVWKTKCAARYAFHGARLQMYRMSCVPKDMISPVLLSSISDA